MQPIEVVETTNPADINSEYASSKLDLKNNRVIIYTKDLLHAIKLEIAKNTLAEMKQNPIYRFGNSGYGLLVLMLVALAFLYLNEYIPHINTIGIAVLFDTIIIMMYSGWICDNIRRNAHKKIVGENKK